jgi:hypothetical protein
MRETLTYGSVGGALGNRRFYPEIFFPSFPPQDIVSTYHQVNPKQTTQINNY